MTELLVRDAVGGYVKYDDALRLKIAVQTLIDAFDNLALEKIMGKNNKFLTGTYDQVVAEMAKSAIENEHIKLLLINTESELSDCKDRIADFKRILNKKLNT